MSMQELVTGYLAAEGYEEQLLEEIGPVVQRYGRLFFTDRPPQKAFWAQNIWLSPEAHAFSSISEAANFLKDKQRNWSLYSYAEHRRAALIQAKLPYLSPKPLVFPTPKPALPMGSWMLLDKNTLLASAACSSLYPHGEAIFDEQKEGPPSRAYLKLWEGLTVKGSRPGPGERCLEIGACPGGWTWVLATLGAEVLCVDKAPLAPHVAAMPGVVFQQGNAFAVTPEKIGAVDWIFSDVACYPEKLFEWVTMWLESGCCKNFICTLKFQGSPSYAVADKFAAIPGSRVLHLSYNKHELTWIL